MIININEVNISIQKRFEFTLYYLKQNKSKYIEDKRLGLIPAGIFSKKTVEFLNLEHYYFFDDNKDLMDSKTFLISNVKKLNKLDMLFVTSYDYGEQIEKKLLNLKIDKKKIFNFVKQKTLNLNFDFDLNIDKIIVDIIKKTDRILFIYSPFFYDIYEKIDIINKHSDFLVCWINLDSDIQNFHFNKEKNVIELNDIIKAIWIIQRYNLESKTVIMTVHPISYYSVAKFFRKLFPNIKLIAYIYDWLNLFCPYEKKYLYKKYTKLNNEQIENEYKSLNEIIAQDLVDGIIYKDGQKNFSLLRNFKNPKLFFPTVKSKKLFIHLNNMDRNNLFKIVFIGSIFSKKTNLPELFNDAILFDIFEKVSNLGFDIGIYYAKSLEKVANEYKRYFYNNPRVTIYKGDILEKLLPRIGKKYGWGWMIYEDDYPIVKKHVKHTLPSKIFTYLALGVPIIVVNNFENSARLIKKYGIGITIDKEDINKLPEIIKKIDYDMLLKNIELARQELCLENYEKDFINFLLKVAK